MKRAFDGSVPQLRSKNLFVKLFLRHSLHAKLYLLHRTDPNNPTVGFVGCSNPTLAGLSKQGELNVDVLDHDACDKLRRWFNDRWNDRWCLDISDKLAEVIDSSSARELTAPSYHIYLKIAYHCRRKHPPACRSFASRLTSVPASSTSRRRL